MDRQQHEDAAAELADDEVELRDEIPERPRRRDHGEAGGIEQADALLAGRGQGLRSGLVRTELPHESVVNGVGAAGLGRLDIYGRVGARRPDGGRFALREKEAFGLEVAHRAQGQPHFKPAGGDTSHGGVEPVPAERGFLEVDAADDLGAGDVRMADVGADPGCALHAGRDRQREGEHVAAKADRAMAGRWFLEEGRGKLHSKTPH
jgi:hypothetical protein